MNDLIKYSLLVGFAIFGIGSYFVLNQPDTQFIVVEKIVPHNLERGPYIIVCQGEKSGREYRFELPAEDFHIVETQNRLLISTVERWEPREVPKPRREPNFLERLFSR